MVRAEAKAMERYKGRSIRVSFFSPGPGAAAAVVWLTAGLSLSAAAPDPVAQLKAGQAALEARQYPLAVKTVEPLAARLPKLADYCAWVLASAEFGLRNYAETPELLESVWKQRPSSPLAARAYLLAADAYRESGSAQQ